MTDKLYFGSGNKLRWYCLKSFELEEHLEDPDCRMFTCLQLEDGRVIINSTIKFSDGTHSQQSFLYDNGRMIVRKEPNLGLIGLQMVNIGLDVYYINGQKCEKFNIETNELESIENLNFNHIKGGTCRYNDNVLVISGINCKEIECLGIDNYWIQLHSLPVSIFDIACVQINNEEILCINNKRTYRVNPETGECIVTTNLRINIDVRPIKRGNFVYCLNFKNELVRYILSDDKWVNLSRSGCCQIY